jgi:hypothetical protein
VHSGQRIRVERWAWKDFAETATCQGLALARREAISAAMTSGTSR